MMAKRPPSFWRFSMLRPYGGVSIWYERNGWGRRLFIVSRQHVRIDWEHIRSVVEGR